MQAELQSQAQQDQARVAQTVAQNNAPAAEIAMAEETETV